MSTKKNDKKISQKFMTGMGALLCLAFGFLLVCNLTIIVKGSLYPEQPPSVFGKTPMVVLSGSMSGHAKDHIEVGDLIIVDKADISQLNKGDVIAFMDGKVVVTHRIVSKDIVDGRVELHTKGDANNFEDEGIVTKDNLVGIYQYRIPKVGDFAIFLQTPLGMVLFVGVPLLGFVLYDFISRRRHIDNERQEKEELEKELERLRKLAHENEKN